MEKLKPSRFWIIWICIYPLLSIVAGLSQYWGWTGFEHYQLENTLCEVHWPRILGCDVFGRNLLTLVLSASSLSLLFALAAVSLSMLLGISLGALLSLSPRPLKFLGSRLLDLLLAFPSLILALAWAAIRGPGWDTLSGALLIGLLPHFMRLMYLRSQEMLSEDYVLAARSMGASTLRVLYRHLSPGLLSLAWVKFPNLFAHALMAEATLSFMGVGVPIGRDSWGSLLYQGKEYLIEAPHIAVGSGLPLVLTLFALQKLAERQKT